MATLNDSLNLQTPMKGILIMDCGSFCLLSWKKELLVVTDSLSNQQRELNYILNESNSRSRSLQICQEQKAQAWRRG